MEHPQQRLLGTQGRKPTHDFLSLCSPALQDPSATTTTTTPSGSYLETHDFLQPLERFGKNVAKEANKVEESAIGKSLPPAPPTTVEHILPGGIGTYSISHISVINQSQRMPKPEGVGVVITGAQSSGSDKNDENSNCSSYTGSGFSLWEESAVKKGKTGKENIAGNRHVIREGGMKMGGMPWMTSMERPSQSSSAHNHPTATISSLSSSRPSSAQKNPSFVDMLKSAKSVQEDEDEEVEEFVIKKEPSTHYKGVLSVKVDTAHHDQKPNTPRSKHSATEQRRRSKINDRFSMLRELIPHGDQKRDKASFLLEVIEYIQFLQEKVHKFEDSCRGWTNEQPAMTPWKNNQRPTEGFIDQPQVQNSVSASALPYASKLNETKHSVALNLPKKDHQNILDSDLSSLETMKDIGQHPRLTNLASPFPSPLQPNVYSPGCGSTSVAAPPPSTLPSDTANTPSQLWQSRSCTTDCTVAGDKSKDQDLTIESGTISISTIYSQGLLSTLTQALQSSGVDLSEANISVQIDLGKRANTSRRDSSTPIFKKNEAPVIDENLTRSRLASTREEKSDKDLKRFKTSRN